VLTKRDLLRCAALAVVATKPGLAGARPGIGGARDIAEAGFIYGLPLVMNYAFMYAHAVDRMSGHFKAPFNQIKNIFTHNDTAIETSILWMDLRSEPVILSVPAVDPKCHYSVMLCDLNTYNYGYIGSPAMGNERGDYMVVGPDWEGATPPEIKKVFWSSTQFSVAGYRTHLHNPDDLDNVKKVQAGYKVQLLSAYLRQSPPWSAPAIDFPNISMALVNTNFFEYLDFALQFAPAEANEAEIRAQLARIGIGPRKTFNFKDLSPEDKAEIVVGIKDGERKIDAAVAEAVNDGRNGIMLGDRAFFNGDWLMRAAAAKAGIYGHDAAEAMDLHPCVLHDAP